MSWRSQQPPLILQRPLRYPAAPPSSLSLEQVCCLRGISHRWFLHLPTLKSYLFSHMTPSPLIPSSCHMEILLLTYMNTISTDSFILLHLTPVCNIHEYYFQEFLHLAAMKSYLLSTWTPSPLILHLAPLISYLLPTWTPSPLIPSSCSIEILLGTRMDTIFTNTFSLLPGDPTCCLHGHCVQSLQPSSAILGGLWVSFASQRML